MTITGRVVDGVIQADNKTDKPSGFLLSKKSYTDFQLRVEFWASNDANSGIFCVAADPKNITDKNCYEANIFDQRPDPTYGTGAIVQIAAVSPMPKAGGKWNTYEITAKGKRLTVTLNGVRTVDIQRQQACQRTDRAPDAAGVIKFRKVQIKSL